MTKVNLEFWCKKKFAWLSKKCRHRPSIQMNWFKRGKKIQELQDHITSLNKQLKARDRTLGKISHKNKELITNCAEKARDFGMIRVNLERSFHDRVMIQMEFPDEVILGTYFRDDVFYHIAGQLIERAYYELPRANLFDRPKELESK